MEIVDLHNSTLPILFIYIILSFRYAVQQVGLLQKKQFCINIALLSQFISGGKVYGFAAEKTE